MGTLAPSRWTKQIIEASQPGMVIFVLLTDRPATRFLKRPRVGGGVDANLTSVDVKLELGVFGCG